VTSSGINLSWAPVSAPPGCTITGYTVYENGKAVQTVQGTSFNIQQLSPSTSYAFTVAANDSAGVSPQSGSLSVKTQGAELNVATSITNLCADTQSYVSLEDLTSGAKGNLSTTCIGATNVRPGQTVNALCPASTQAQGNGYGVWRANFTDNVTGAIHSNPNSVGSVSGFVLLNATEVNAALQSDCKTVTLTYKLAQTAPAGTGNGGAAAPASLALPTVQAPDSLPAFRYYTGSAPNSYTVLESGSGQQKLKSLKKAAQQVNPDLGSPDLMPHDVSAQ
jgi:chitodextrinase